MKIHSLSVQSDVLSIQAKLSNTLFEDRSTLRDVTSEVLHKLFHMCHIEDNFSVDVTFKIQGVDGIDPSKFIIKELSDKEITKDGDNLLDRNATYSTEPSMSPLTLTPDILKECLQSKNDLKKRRLAHLYKKYSSSLFYTRPTSEQVLKKPVNPSISYTNKKYLSAIRRYKGK
ncbi:hypothetical protein AM593_05293, partial [Mytilus galloprovincialis]